MSTAYRSAYDHVVGLKLAETEDARAQLDPLMPGIRRIEDFRMVRIIAGGIGIAATLMMLGFAIALDRNGLTTCMLLGGTMATLFAWLFGRSVLGIARRFEKTKSIRLALSGVLDADLASIDASDPRTELHRIEGRLARLEAPSFYLPATATGCLLPLTLHYLFIQALTLTHGGDAGLSATDFDQWVRISLVIVGHAHIALVVLCIMFAKRIAKMTTDDLAKMRIHHEWSKIWFIVIGISCVPGIVLYLIPPIIVAVTGLAVIPFIVTFLQRAVLAEHTQLALAHAASRVRVGDVVAPAEWLAKEQERESAREHEDTDRDADDGAEGEAGLLAAHRIGNHGARG